MEKIVVSSISQCDGQDTSHLGPSGGQPKGHYGKPTFLNLANVVHHLICSELYATSPTSLQALALVSSSMDAIAKRYIFRDLVLWDAPSGPRRQKCDHLLELMQAEMGKTLATYVRHIRVEEDLTSLAALETILDRCNSLHRFSWNAKMHMPALILRKLQDTWPNLQISVRNYQRQVCAPDFVSLDKALLACSQLTSLHSTIFHSRGRRGGQGSEFGPLAEALMAGGHCKSIRIHVDSSGDQSRFPCMLSTEESETTLARGSQHAFLKPEELSLFIGNCERRFVETTHEQFLLCCLGPSLKRLEVTCEADILPSLAGRTPNLKYFTYGLPRREQTTRYLLDYLQQLADMEGLDIRADYECFSRLWPEIHRQRHSLKELIWRPYDYAMSIELLRRISAEMRSLERLGFLVPYNQHAEDGEIPLGDSYLSEFKGMGLKALDIFVHLPDEACDFADDFGSYYTARPPTPLKIEPCKRIGAAIADSISASQRRPLQTLTMHFIKELSRFEHLFVDGETKVQLRRTNRDDAEMLGDEKYKMIELSEWRNAKYWNPGDLDALQFP